MRNSKGFTLMELIIVLAVLAILAMILIPTFMNTTDRARLRSDIQSARAIQNAMDLHRVERNPAAGWGENWSDALIEDLAGILAVRPPQTEGADWIIEDEHVKVDIRTSPAGAQRAYENLSDSERWFVVNNP